MIYSDFIFPSFGSRKVRRRFAGASKQKRSV
nr:MAG TPA: hypothetical protein [Caudoviricetes sp.]